MKTGLLYIVLFLLVLCIPFYSAGDEVRWLWAELLWVPFACILFALGLLGVYLFKVESSDRN